jgi:hypothetical protein
MSSICSNPVVFLSATDGPETTIQLLHAYLQYWEANRYNMDPYAYISEGLSQAKPIYNLDEPLGSAIHVVADGASAVSELSLSDIITQAASHITKASL